jgi:hypothetical protein
MNGPVRITLDLPGDLADLLAAHVAGRRCSRNAAVEKLLRDALAPAEAPAPAKKPHPWRSLACSPRVVPGGRRA